MFVSLSGVLQAAIAMDYDQLPKIQRLSNKYRLPMPEYFMIYISCFSRHILVNCMSRVDKIFWHRESVFVTQSLDFG